MTNFKKTKNKKFKLKIFISLLLLFGIFVIPYIIKLLFYVKKYNINIIPSNFSESSILDYYGVIISGCITLFVLKYTIRDNNDNLRKEFETQVKQRKIQKFEDEILKIITSMNFDYVFIENVRQIKKVLDMSNIHPIYNLVFGIRNHVQNKIAYIESLKINIELYNCIEHMKDMNNYVIDLKNELERNYKKLKSIYEKIDNLFKIVEELFIIDNNNRLIIGQKQNISHEQTSAYTAKVTEMKIEINNYCEKFDDNKNEEYKKFIGKMKNFLELMNGEYLNLDDYKEDN